MPEIVLATPSWKNSSATKLNAAAHSTAARGDSTRVATTVATELAASWKPLMMSKAKAATMVAMTRKVMTGLRSGVLEDHALDHVGDVLAAVARRLHELVDLLPLDDLDGISLLAEQPGDGAAQDGVGLVFEPVD